MRGQTIALAIVLIGVATPASAQSEQAAEEPRTAEQFVETARAAYSVIERSQPCPTPVGNEIVVCRERIDPASQRLASPTERANAQGRKPPDPRPDAPYVLGLPECGVEVVCHGIGAAPPPIYIIDLAAIPEPLTPQEAARVVRAEETPETIPSPEAASPAAAP